VSDAQQTLAANLRRYRSALGLSQQALADKAGLSRVGYRDIESGVATPRTDSLTRIAEALGVRTKELLAPVRTLSHVRFRAHKRMSTRENVLSNVARWLDDYVELEELVGQRRPWGLGALAIDLRKSKPGLDRARDAAARARSELGLANGRHDDTIRDVGGLLDDNGIKVLTADVKSEGFFGLSVGSEDGGPAVVVNVWDRISVERWIFTAVHELGHLLLHPGAYSVGEVEEVDAEEKEADAFAGHFLMPDTLFDKEWEEARGFGFVDRVLKVKRIFKVSWQTVVYRVASRMAEAERPKLWKSFHALYAQQYGHELGKVDEPKSLPPDEFFSGRPVARSADEPARLLEEDFREDRLHRLVRAAVEAKKITMSRAAEILECDLRSMRRLASSWVE
jgi:Zn-dependent peptidase ImmA (M78 family)/transcriptional regulator with XRE-family HTH domain